MLLLFVASLDQQPQQPQQQQQQQPQQQEQRLLLQQLPGNSSRARWGGIGRAIDFAAANNLQLAGVQWFTAQAANPKP